jgi:hypothetical protein
MCFRLTSSGELLHIWTVSLHDEVMRLCARIGFKP